MKIVWLEPPNFSIGMRKVAQNYLRKQGFNLYDVQFVALTEGCLVKETKTRWVADEVQEPEFKAKLLQLKPDFIICNDKASLNYITGKYISLALCRGSMYNYLGIPTLVINDVLQTKRTNIGGWVLLQDLAKAKRWTMGQLREEPRFSYTVCHAITDVKSLLEVAKLSTIIGVDIETTGTTISSIQYACLYRADFQLGEGPYRLHTWVVPFINPLKKDGCHWEDEAYEIQVWRYIRQVNATGAYKCMQNGSYDSAYFLKYRIPLRNYICDTLHGWHSVWVESPKRIDFIASIALDKYVYWKDEGKVEDKKEDTKGGAIPKTKTGLGNYWRYGALDSHNTLLCFRFILAVMQMDKLKWTLENYRNEMRQQFGQA